MYLRTYLIQPYFFFLMRQLKPREVTGLQVVCMSSPIPSPLHALPTTSTHSVSQLLQFSYYVLYIYSNFTCYFLFLLPGRPLFQSLPRNCLRFNGISVEVLPRYSELLPLLHFNTTKPSPGAYA